MIEERYVLKICIRRLINKIQLLIIIILLGMISIKLNPDLKVKFKEIIYENNFNIMTNKKIYEKYFGNILSSNKSTVQMVSSEKIAYKKIEKYKNGAKLIVSTNYSIPVLESGVVTYLKDKTIIIEQVNGIQTYYSNIVTDNIKLYDYLEKGKILGQANGNEVYLEFKKDGKYLDYQKYL